MKPRITLCVRPDGSLQIHVNEAGRDLLVEELDGLHRGWDHVHLDHMPPEMEWTTEVPLRAVPYGPEDRVVVNAVISLRPDDWDRKHFPHVMEGFEADNDG